MHAHKESGLKLQYWFALSNLFMYSILKAWNSILETAVTLQHASETPDRFWSLQKVEPHIN